MKARNHFISWLALTLLLQPSLAIAEDAPPAPVSPYAVVPPTTVSTTSVQASAGVQSMSAHGLGASGSLTLGHPRLPFKNADGVTVAVGLAPGPRLHVQGQAGTDDAGKSTLSRGQVQVRIVKVDDPGHVPSASTIGTVSDSFQLFGGAEVSRHLGLGREVGANLQLGTFWESKDGNQTQHFTTTGEIGANKVGGYVVPYVQVRGTYENEQCKDLGNSDRNQVCLTLSATAAIGLLQMEAGAGAGLTVQRRIADDGSKVYAGAQAEVGGSVDPVSMHSYSQAGAAMGVKF